MSDTFVGIVAVIAAFLMIAAGAAGCYTRADALFEYMMTDPRAPV